MLESEFWIIWYGGFQVPLFAPCQVSELLNPEPEGAATCVHVPVVEAQADPADRKQQSSKDGADATIFISRFSHRLRHRELGWGSWAHPDPAAVEQSRPAGLVGVAERLSKPRHIRPAGKRLPSGRNQV